MGADLQKRKEKIKTSMRKRETLHTGSALLCVMYVVSTMRACKLQHHCTKLAAKNTDCCRLLGWGYISILAERLLKDFQLLSTSYCVTPAKTRSILKKRDEWGIVWKCVLCLMLMTSSTDLATGGTQEKSEGSIYLSPIHKQWLKPLK